MSKRSRQTRAAAARRHIQRSGNTQNRRLYAPSSTPRRNQRQRTRGQPQSWRSFNSNTQSHLLPTLVGAVAMVVLVVFIAARPLSARARPNRKTTAPAFTGSIASPEVRTVVQLPSPFQNPRQLAYDATRNGLWFWTSTTRDGSQPDNQLYFYDIGHQRLQSWPLYDGDWSSQLHAGLAVAPNADIWIGWNHNLVDFVPATGQYARYVLPVQPRYPLPTAIVGDRPADLGVSDLVVGRDGTVWIARYGNLSLTRFSPTTHTFQEIPLPATTGDPAKLALSPTGELFFTTNLSASHLNYGLETVGEYDPQTGVVQVFAQPARALAITPGGDLYVALQGKGFGVRSLAAGERASAQAHSRTPVFQRLTPPFDVADDALATDAKGRVWMAVGGMPQIAVLDPASGTLRTFQYAAPSIAGHQLPSMPITAHPETAAPGAVWLVPIVAMVTDGQGHLWYMRAGYHSLEEITA